MLGVLDHLLFRFFIKYVAVIEYVVTMVHFRFRATSHTSPGSRPCDCEGLWLSPKGRIRFSLDMVCWNLWNAYLVEVSLMQISANHKTSSIVYHVRNHVDVSIHVFSFGLLGLRILVWSELEQSRPLWPTRELKMHWSHAFSFMCEVALTLSLRACPLQNWLSIYNNTAFGWFSKANKIIRS